MEPINEWTYFIQNPQYCEWRKWDNVTTFGMKRDIKDNKGMIVEEIICIKKYLTDLNPQGDNTYIYLTDEEKILYEEIILNQYYLYNNVCINLEFPKIYNMAYKNEKELSLWILNKVKNNRNYNDFYLFENNRIYNITSSIYTRTKNETLCPCCFITGNIGARGYMGRGSRDSEWNFVDFLKKINIKYKL